jgi:hypothetical protein
MFRPLCLSIATGLFSLPLWADTSLRVSAAGSITAIGTEEYAENGTLLNEESGSLMGGGLGFEWLSDTFYIGGSLELGDGDVTYTGKSQQGVPIKDGSSYLYYWRTRVYVGKELSALPFKPRVELELGGQLKERHIDPNVPNLDDYQEDYTWWFGGIGTSLEVLGNEDFSWRLGVNYRSMIKPQNDVSSIDLQLELGSTDSLTLRNSLSYHLGGGLYLGGELDITRTDIARSRPQYKGREFGSYVQPQSQWDDLGFRLVLSKAL